MTIAEDFSTKERHFGKRRFPLPTHCTSSGALATLYQGSVKVQDQRSEIQRLKQQTVEKKKLDRKPYKYFCFKHNMNIVLEGHCQGGWRSLHPFDDIVNLFYILGLC